jgi:hypothetical protein
MRVRSLLRFHLTLLLTTLLVLTLALPPAPAFAGARFERVERHLKDLGYPVGTVDGVQTAASRRALCAWRRSEGRSVHRGKIQSAEFDAILATRRLPKVSRTSRHVVVDRTCQVLTYRKDGEVRRVFPVSTGRPGKETPAGVFSVYRKRAGWHTSTLYPAPQPNMYNSMYFNGAVAMHGAREVPTYPASSGCVRLRPKHADWLWPRVPLKTRVEVIGRW